MSNRYNKKHFEGALKQFKENNTKVALIIGISVRDKSIDLISSDELTEWNGNVMKEIETYQRIEKLLETATLKVASEIQKLEARRN